MKWKTLKLNKIEVAERQLKEAIHLFFEQRDCVSIHTLAAAAYQILYDNSKKLPIYDEFRDSVRIKDEYRKKWNQFLSEAQNFFKHGSRDLNKTLEFRPEITKFFIIFAVLLYIKLKGSCLFEHDVFLLYFGFNYPDCFEGEEHKRAIEMSLERGFDPSDFEFFIFILKNFKSISELQDYCRASKMDTIDIG